VKAGSFRLMGPGIGQRVDRYVGDFRNQFADFSLQIGGFRPYLLRNSHELFDDPTAVEGYHCVERDVGFSDNASLPSSHAMLDEEEVPGTGKIQRGLHVGILELLDERVPEAVLEGNVAGDGVEQGHAVRRVGAE